VADGAPSMVGRNSGVSSLIASDVKNKTNRSFIIFRVVPQNDDCRYSCFKTH
jgi:hypothetical protein